MAVTWDNNGEPNAQGEYVARITSDTGAAPQVFKGTSYKEVADKLLHAQEHASRAITELKRGRTPEPATPRRRAEPKPLTAGERMTVAHDITDPAKAPEAITRVVESVVGDPKIVREAINKMDDDEDARAAGEQAALFAASHPEYYGNEFNNGVMVRYMQNQGYAPTLKNFDLAFDELRSAGLLQSRSPEAEEGEGQEPPPKVNGHGGQSQPTVRPRGTLTTTSIRASDTSGGPRPARARYTKADIEKMSTAVYKEKLTSEPGFADIVNALYKQ